MFQTPRRRIAPGTAQAPGDRRWAQDPSWAATGIRAAEAFHKAASSISDSDSTGHAARNELYVPSRVERSNEVVEGN